jgi:nucleoid-associated protein Lsr2
MARRVIHELVDDLDGKPSDETVTFGLDGVQYQIDLSAGNATRLRATFVPYTDAGTRLGRTAAAARRASAPRSGRQTGKVDPDQNQAIRAWAQSRGISISDRGRIRQDVIDRYQREAGR